MSDFLQVTSFDPLIVASTGAHVISASIDGSNHLLLHMSDSTTIDAGALPSGGGGGTGTVLSITAGDSTVTVNNTDPANPTVRVTSGTFDPAGSADAKVIDSIADADTTHAPSRNAVFDALALKAADSAVVHNTAAETVNGVKTFGSLPVLPGNPTTALQAVPKQYVDSAILPATFVVTAFGAKADAQTYWTGATTSGSAVLTDTTTHPFTSGDVGKRVVVNNALGVGVHLYTTISAFTDSSHVTLAANATATVAVALYTFGTDDKAAWDAAFAAVPSTGGQVIAPGTPSLVYGAINVPRACTITGSGCFPTSFVGTTAASSDNVPIFAPFLTGSVLVQAKSGEDGFAGQIVGQAVNFQGIGVFFAGLFFNTGNGLNFTSTVNGASGNNAGLTGSHWRQVNVFGHDLTHYGFVIQNPLFNVLELTNSWGGGGYKIEQNSSVYNYGNSTFIQPNACVMGGAAHGFYMLPTLGFPNILTFLFPQALGKNLAFTGWAGWGLPGWSGFCFNGAGSVNTSLYGSAFEGPNSVSVGNYFEMGGAYEASGSVGGLRDTAPFLRKLNTGRRINLDGSVSLDSAETAGTALWLLQDNIVAGAGLRWGISTDGTRKMTLPGTLQVSGNLPSSVAGANNGTSPPSPNLTGTDAAGSAVFGSGTTPAAGAQVAVTFAVAYGQPPTVILTANNAATQALGLYATRTASGFVVNSSSAPSASQALGTFDVSYTVIGGQTPAITPPVSDTFTRADSATTLGTADVGGAWTPQTGTWGISSNQAYKASGSTGAALIDSGKADCKIQATQAVVSGSNSGIAFRIVDANNYWLASANTLWKVQAGSFISVGTYAAFTAGQVMQVILNGSAITVLKNGVVIATASDSFQSTATKHGLWTDNSTQRFDNFLVG